MDSLLAFSSQRYLQLVHDLLWRYRGEAVALTLQLNGALHDLARLEDELRRPELPRPSRLLAEHESLTARVEILERDLHDAREASRGAEEELRGIEAALLD